jgi:hypothetical protein
VSNNPLRYTDPTGHVRVEEAGSKRGCTDPKYCQNGKPKPDDGSGKTQNPGLPCKNCHSQPVQQPNSQSTGCTPTHPCLQPMPENPSWWDVDPTNPDYYVLSVSAGPPGLPGITTTLTIDRYKNIYGGAWC